MTMAHTYKVFSNALYYHLIIGTLQQAYFQVYPITL